MHPPAHFTTVFVDPSSASRSSNRRSLSGKEKRFQKGRAIISDSGSLCSKLLQVAAIVISIMTKTLYPDAPGMQSMPQLWQWLHQHWAKPNALPDQEWNDDLVGFFNAVPRRDIAAAVTLLTEQFLNHFSRRVLSVDIASRTGHRGKPRGRNTSQLKRCWVQDIPSIVEVSFNTGVFTAAGRCRLEKKAHASETRYLLYCLDCQS